MGNDCFKDTTQNTHEVQLHEEQQNLHSTPDQKRRREPSNVKGAYLQQLQNDRNVTIKSKEGRNANDKAKLQQLKRNLDNFQTNAVKDKQYEFRHKKYAAQIETLDRIIKNRQEQIRNLQKDSVSRIK